MQNRATKDDGQVGLSSLAGQQYIYTVFPAHVYGPVGPVGLAGQVNKLTTHPYDPLLFCYHKLSSQKLYKMKVHIFTNKQKIIIFATNGKKMLH
jgi:hypothetical protein